MIRRQSPVADHGGIGRLDESFERKLFAVSAQALDSPLSRPARCGSSPTGQVMFVFILTVAAVEVAVGLALVLWLYHWFRDARRGSRKQDGRLTC